MIGTNCVEELLALLEPALRQVVRGAADREVAVREPRAAGHFEQVEDLFALAEGVEKRAERPQIEAVRAHADQVAGDAVHLGR
jgi:hypothetical protein